MNFFLNIAQDLPLLRADHRVLTQVLNNLLSNAIKFTPSGGRVELSAEVNADKEFTIRISDTGVGMSKKGIQQAMLPFEQADTQHSRTHHEGTGLGLPLCISFMHLHGGDIFVESEPDHGTTVTLRFPPERTLFGTANR